jgi:hypothetical protein
MTYQPLKKRDVFVLVGLAVLGIATAGVASALFGVSDFGEGMRLAVTRRQARQISSQYLEGIGISTEGYRSVVTFSSDFSPLAGTYILRQLGMERTNEIVTQEYPFWAWHIRWFKPLQKEEVGVDVGPKGKVVGLYHSLEEDQEGADLTLQEAQWVAEDFITRVQELDLSRYSLVESSSTKRKCRTDHDFVWERDDQKVADGAFRLGLSVKGDQPYDFYHFFKVPEEFKRKEGEAGIKEVVVGGIMATLAIAFFIATVVLFFLKFKAHQIDWRFTLIMAVILGGWHLIGELNDLPTFMAYYPTIMDIAVFFTHGIIGICMGLLFAILVFCLLFSVAESLFRELLPEAPTIPQQLARLRPRNWLSRQYLDGCLVGYLSPGVFMGFVAISSMVEQRFLSSSIEARSHIPASVIETFIPSLAGWGSAWFAALGGTFTFLLVVALLRKFLKRPRWVCLAVGVFPILVVALNSKSLCAGLTRGALALFGLAIAIYIIFKYFRFNPLAYLFAFYFPGLLGTGWYMLTFRHPYFLWHGGVLLTLAFLPAVLPLAAWLKRRFIVREGLI